ncbi:hypothetical protein GUITHDRAFT_121788 [Guillardia theta CCMP2712]|uniref:Laminin EGF-like domain-containing protein n=2 Tax=Guillardia theta TaxID=55529 RepID=L1I711_GUITC|nr:hypothetical protein GUITHDRAFT_121788 [Guillardia theta CCMP2712]EKX32041.1 hypothetical protein GUITHDRAFT_121788 [Guillardia theta CCMP2712]|eukprot:XP_005819021.1 hypothetical protein GUITHDRAFT_121788 [Guillardia theta CCMP2712]
MTFIQQLQLFEQYAIILGCIACNQGIVASERTDCACLPGYTGADCTACPAGWYKELYGDSPCIQCPAGLFQPSTGSSVCRSCGINQYSGVAALSCTPCPANTISNESNPSIYGCVCKMGYGALDPNQCSLCVPGKYKSSNALELCTDCPSNRVSPYGSTTQFHCVCRAGYYRDSNFYCQPCPLGLWKESDGDAECTACPIHSTTLVKGGAAISACQCEPGYFEADAQVCSPCPSSFYNPDYNVSLCRRCPDFSYSPVASKEITSCQCYRGYGWNGTACVECPAGSYKSYMGVGSCVPCPEGSTSLPANSDVLKCYCKPGYTGNNGAVCTPCDYNTYKPEPYSGLCSACPPHMVTAGRGSIDVSQCVCDVGYYYKTSDRVCVPCGIGTYRDSLGLASCITCPNNQSTVGQAAASVADCVCGAGFTGKDGEACQACMPGSFRSSSDSEPLKNINYASLFAPSGSIPAIAPRYRTVDAVFVFDVVFPSSIPQGMKLLEFGGSDVGVWIGVVSVGGAWVMRARAGDGSQTITSGVSYTGLAYAEMPR